MSFGIISRILNVFLTLCQKFFKTYIFTIEYRNIYKNFGVCAKKQIEVICNKKTQPI